jgi:iron complex outermembrane receptor protein
MTNIRHGLSSKAGFILFILTASTLSLFSANTFAQNQGEEYSMVLEEVIVTATKREVNVQDIAISISTLSGDDLKAMAAGGADIRFLRARMPSLYIESSFGRAQPRFYIRGYGNTDFDLNASQPVSLVYDEVVQENSILKGFPVFDLARVELLRGPQGTLYGRNTPAGIVKFDSVRPSTETDAYARVSAGNRGSFNFEGAVGGGFGDNWSGRLSFMYMTRDDWVDNIDGFTGEKKTELEGFDEWAVRAQLAYDAGSNFTALLNFHARDLEGSARLFRANIIKQGTNDFTDDYDRKVIFTDGDNFQDLDSHGAIANLTWDFGPVTLTSVTGYESVDVFSRGDIDGGYGAAFLGPGNFGPGFIPFPSESAGSVPDHSQFTQEFRLSSNYSGRFDWQGGFFYFDEDLTIDNFGYDTLGGGVQNIWARQVQETTAWGLFVSGNYDISDSFTLGGGLRYSDDDKDFVAERFQTAFGGANIGPLYANPGDSKVTWDIMGTWTMNDDVNFYARIATGFRAPAVQGRISFGDTISVADSETNISYEAGVKTTLADGRIRFNFNLFSYTVDDLQLTAVGGVANVTQLINADKAKGSGFELDFEALLTENFLITAGLSYNDTEIDDPGLSVFACGAPCTVLDPPGTTPGTVDIDGNSLPQAPEWVANMTARWSMQTDSGEFFVFGDWAYRSKVNFFLYESVEFTGKPLSEIGLRAGYNWSNGSQQVAVFGRNIFNQDRIVGGIDFNNLTGFVNDPAIWGVEYQFLMQ